MGYCHCDLLLYEKCIQEARRSQMLSPVTGDNSCRLTHFQHPNVHVPTAIRLGICFSQNSSCPPVFFSFEATNDRLWNLGALTRHPPSSSIPQTLREPPPCWTKGLRHLGIEALPQKCWGVPKYHEGRKFLERDATKATNQKNKLKTVQKKVSILNLMGGKPTHM